MASASGRVFTPELRAVGADQADLASANAIVDAGVVCGQCGITSCCWAADAKATADASGSVHRRAGRRRLARNGPDVGGTLRFGPAGGDHAIG